jgi:hypothetical protein
VSPDTPDAFLADPDFTTAATSAVAPPGYFLAEGYQNLQASASDPSYLTYVSSQLTSYDPAACATLCTNMAGCVSFNICMLCLLSFEYCSANQLQTLNGTPPFTLTIPHARLLRLSPVLSAHSLALPLPSPMRPTLANSRTTSRS